MNEYLKASKIFSNIVLIVGLFLSFLFLYFALNKCISMNGSAFPKGLILYDIYYLFSFLGILGFGFSLKLPEDFKIKIALISISVTLPIFLLELFLTVTSSQALKLHERVLRAEKEKKLFDTRTTLEVVKDFQEKGLDVSPSFYPKQVFKEGLRSEHGAIYPLANISRKTIVDCNESGEFSIFQTDDHGFNNPLGIFDNEKIDIALVGDSFTRGACVSTSEGVASWLRKYDKHVINLGVNGIGPLIELALIKEYVEPLKPKIVLWMYFEGNDLGDLHAEENKKILRAYLNPNFSQNLIDRQLEIDKAVGEFIETRIKSQNEKMEFENVRPSILFLPYIRERLIDLFYPTLPLFKEVLAKAKLCVSSWGGELFFVYLPTYSRYSKIVNHDNYLKRRAVISIIKDLDVPIIDFHEVIISHSDPLSLFPFRFHGHYTPEGYRLLAEKIEWNLKIALPMESKKVSIKI